MKKHIEVVAAIIKKDNKFFCSQRANKGELAKKWEFPGGKIEKDETHQQALAREIKEELKTDIVVKEFLLTIHHEYESFFLIMHCYTCEIISGTLSLTEHLDFRWLTPFEMGAYDFAQADIPIIEHLKKL